MVNAKEHLANGRLIEAIRSWRAATGEPLKESKDALESIRSGEREWPSMEDKGFCGACGNPKGTA
jgi:ribosomal protein L7/L12